jgi:hypothetical protein
MVRKIVDMAASVVEFYSGDGEDRVQKTHDAVPDQIVDDHPSGTPLDLSGIRALPSVPRYARGERKVTRKDRRRERTV